jgi:2-hydroxy-3-keto-5-methylthiopentenyl-1-phosphate phosphatase
VNRTLAIDFDGTITEDDTLDATARQFCNRWVYRRLDRGLTRGSLTLREVITGEFERIRAPLDEVVDWVLGRARIRPGFREFIKLAEDRGWRALVLSSGFHELIEPVLAREGLKVELRANRIEPDPSGWRVLWRDETICAVCAEACKRSALSTEGEIIYVGDGFSDRCAALASDRVFATKGLARYLEEQGVAYEPFDDFVDVARALG